METSLIIIIFGPNTKKAICSGVEVWQRLKGYGSFYNCISFYGCPAAIDRTIEQVVGEWGDGLWTKGSVRDLRWTVLII